MYSRPWRRSLAKKALIHYHIVIIIIFNIYIYIYISDQTTIIYSSVDWTGTLGIHIIQIHSYVISVVLPAGRSDFHLSSTIKICSFCLFSYQLNIQVSLDYRRCVSYHSSSIYLWTLLFTWETRSRPDVFFNCRTSLHGWHCWCIGFLVDRECLWLYCTVEEAVAPDCLFSVTLTLTTNALCSIIWLASGLIHVLWRLKLPSQWLALK